MFGWPASVADLNIHFELLLFDEPRPLQLFAECARDLNSNGVEWRTGGNC